MKICILTSVHQPFDVRIFLKEGKSLAKAGHEVTLVVASSRTDLFDENIRFRVITPVRGRLLRMIWTVSRVIKAGWNEHADVYHLHDPELLLGGLLLKCLGKKVVYDVHEDYPAAILSKEWIPNVFRQLISTIFLGFEKIIAVSLDAVIPATPKIHSHFQQYCKRVVTIQNFPILNELNTRKGQIDWSEREDAVIFSGGITKLRGGVEMIKAVDLVVADMPVAQMYLAGSFVPSKFKSEIEQLAGWNSVEYLGFISRESLASYFGRAKMGLLLFHPAPNHLEAQPNKLFEYMSAGLPVIVSDFPLWREIIEKYECGLVVDPLDCMAIAEKIKYIFENSLEAAQMGKKGEKAVYDHFNWGVEEEKLITLYEDLS